MEFLGAYHASVGATLMICSSVGECSGTSKGNRERTWEGVSISETCGDRMSASGMECHYAKSLKGTLNLEIQETIWYVSVLPERFRIELNPG